MQKITSNKMVPLVLVGMMGSGKSVVAKQLAAVMQRPFADSDVQIEKMAGKTVTEIFASEGEAAFRALEKQVIQELLADQSLILAVGGGAFVQPDLQKWLQEHACCIWLQASADTLIARLSGDSTRPLLQNKNASEKKQTIEDLLAKRQPHYSKAHIRLAVDGRKIEDVVAEIVRTLHKGS